jgi:hypothetical protein
VLEVFYIGANVPLKDAQFVNDTKKPDFVYIHLTSTSPGFNFEKFLRQTCRKDLKAKDHRILVFLPHVIKDPFLKMLNSNIHLLNL